MTLELSQGVRIDSLRLQPDLQRRVAAVEGVGHELVLGLEEEEDRDGEGAGVGLDPAVVAGRHLGRGRPILPPMPIPYFRQLTDELA